MPSLDLEKVQTFVARTKEKDDINKRLKALQIELDDLEETLLPQFVADNCNNIRMDGYLVSIYPDIFASPLREDDRLGVAYALKESGLAHFVKENYDSRTITSWVRELAESIKDQCQRENLIFDEETLARALPEPLRNALKISFIHRMRVNRPQKGVK